MNKKSRPSAGSKQHGLPQYTRQAVFWEEGRLSFDNTVVNNSGILMGSIAANAFL